MLKEAEDLPSYSKKMIRADILQVSCYEKANKTDLRCTQTMIEIYQYPFANLMEFYPNCQSIRI